MRTASAAVFAAAPEAEAARLENDKLVLRVFQNGAFAVTMRSGAEWLPDPWQSIACRVSFSHGQRPALETLAFSKTGEAEVSKTPAGIRSVFRGRGVTVRTRLELDGSTVRASIEEVALPEGAWLVSVEYPFRAFYLRTGKDDGYLALTSGEGCLVPAGTVRLGATRFWSWHDESHGPSSDVTDFAPSMPFWGAQKGGAGYTAIVETSDDFLFRYLINSDSQHTFIESGRQSPFVRIACAWPLWQSQKGALGYQRSIRFEFATGLDYVGMAKAYRKEAVARGHHVTLREKAKVRPQIARLAGAPYLAYYAGYPHVPPGDPNFDYRYSQLDEVVADLAGPMGLRRAFVHFWGGFTTQPPGALPFDTRPGSVEELKSIVRKARQAGFLFTFYNDFSAQLEETGLWMPELTWKDRQQRIAGRRWSRTCSSRFISLASKHLPEIARTMNLEACYIDCINAGVMRECYDPAHPLTRSEERKARTDFYRYVHSLGMIFGGEHVGWWNAAELEYTNGIGIMRGLGLLNLFPVPLYNLVFHDALVPFCHAADDYTMNQSASFEDKLLRDLLRGIPPMFFMNLRDHSRWRTKIAMSYAVLSDTAARVMFDEMLAHQWLTEDQTVQQSRFASGVEVKVNFDEVEREGMPAKSYRILGLGSRPKSGSFSLQLS